MERVKTGGAIGEAVATRKESNAYSVRFLNIFLSIAVFLVQLSTGCHHPQLVLLFRRLNKRHTNMSMQADTFIRHTLSISWVHIETDAAKAVEHYLDHDEYEIAFEGLFLEIMQLEQTPPIDLFESKKIAMQLKLHEVSVLDIDFWSKFRLFLSGNNM